MFWIDAFRAELIGWPLFGQLTELAFAAVSVKQVCRKIPMIQLRRWEDLVAYNANVCLGSALLIGP